MRETEKLYNSITNINADFIEEAQNATWKRKHQAWTRQGMAAACFIFAVAAVFLALNGNIFAPEKDEYADSGKGNISPGGNQSGYSAADPEKIADGTETIVQNQTVGNQGMGVLSGSTSESTVDPEKESILYYSELVGMDDTADREILAKFAAATVDIASFSESMLENCAAIVEGEIVDIHLKNYRFTTANDKFGDGGTLNYNMDTVVYELKIAKVWYGEMEAGSTVTVEDQFFCADKTLALKAGHRYVIPLYEAGDKIWAFDHKEFLGGDIQRDSIYSTVYPHHPQIEAVEKGYIVPEEWETLTAGEKAKIIMDVGDGEEGAFYRDKMMFVPEGAFSGQMDILIRAVGFGLSILSQTIDFLPFRA